MAVDIGTPSGTTITFSHPIYRWLNTNAGRYGWLNPDGARRGGRGPTEAWHWEYYGTTPR
jgi:LAS superfamily LD-carboxypeptidase LdcB